MADIITTNLDAGTDSPAAARAQIFEAVRRVNSGVRTIYNYGVNGSGLIDDSAACQQMIDELNFLFVPRGCHVKAKNLQLFDSTIVCIEGRISLPNGCADFDRLLYAVNKANVKIYAEELDGNAAGQSGSIGTHLVYLTGCTAPVVSIDYVHDHYVSAGAAMPSVDGIRNTSSGAVFLQGAYAAKVHIGQIKGWGREAVYLLDCVLSQAGVRNALATGNTEYSGLQVGGQYNHILYATVDGAGASAVGFDTKYGTVSNVVALNTRAQHGLNFGHPGRPATGSSASNIIIDGCYGNGINIQSTSDDVTVSDFQVRNCGGLGLSTSDGSTNSKFTNGVVGFASGGNLNALGTDVVCTNVKSKDIDAIVLTCATVAGIFLEGETIQTSTGSGTARRIIKDLTGANQKIFITAFSGTFSVSQVLTGATSAASATISATATPTQYNEISGGRVIDSDRFYSGAVGNQYRLPDGTALYFHSASISLSAGAIGTITLTYASNVLWVSAPQVIATLASASLTGAYTLQTLQASSTNTTGTIRIKTDVTQTYGVNVIAVGRWK